MKSLGVAMVGGHGARSKDDFYPTPSAATDALCRSGLLWPNLNMAWEPACGDGAMAKVLERNGYDVIATDLVDRGYGSQIDFLEAKELLASTIVTNPPFNLAERFIRHALGLKAKQVAMLLKSQFWHAAGRLPLFTESPPSVVAPLTWRLDFTGGGAPTMDCAWVVWGGPLTGPSTVYMPLSRPDLTAEMLA